MTRYRNWHRWPGRTLRTLIPRRIRRMILIPLVMLAIGTVAYPAIEGGEWTLFDGLYMTVITLTTLGYGELHPPLSTPGRVFTIFLAIGGIFVLFYIATDVVRSIITGELQELVGKERMADRLKHMEGHTIVCGFGRMGKTVCDELERLQQPFVVIDPAPPGDEWPHALGIRLQGDAAEDHVLRHAGIERARALVTVVGSDANNLYISLSARLLNPALVIIARAEEAEAEAKLLKVGVNKVISPYLEGGHRAVQSIFKPSLQHFVDQVTRSELIDLTIEEFPVQSGCELAGQTVGQTRLRSQFGITILGIVQADGKLAIAPSGDETIEAGTTLIAIGLRQQLQAAVALTRSAQSANASK